ncbi:MAG: DUF6498-containing protein [Sediminibacterium sp.]|nr:DUF6498-containing protein [uncultured Sediminibacterium sp.]
MEPSIYKYFLPTGRNLFIWANSLLMLAGLFFFGWRPVIIVFAYVFETIIIGIIHLFKLWYVLKYGEAQNNHVASKDPRQINGYGIIPFFLVHYFFFIFVQSVFIFSAVGKSLPGLSSDAFNVFGNYKFLLSQTDMQLAFASIALANIGYTFRNFFVTGRYHKYTVNMLFMQPYIRIFIQQLVAILAGFFFFFKDGAMVAALLLIITRLVLDLYLQAIKYNAQARNKLKEKLSAKGSKLQVTDEQLDLFLE